MCVIAIQPRGIQISRKELKNCWDNNSHGAGLMYSNNGKIIVKKEMESFDKFMEYVNEASKYDSALVIHFRIATSGGINDYNCHPFKVHKNLYFCHNGILDIDVPKGSKENDTQIFNNSLMKPLPFNFYKNNAIMNILEYTIGSGNKFVFLDDKGDYYILNEAAGEWSENGAWFSNTSYKREKFVYSKSYYAKPYSYYGWEDDWYDTTPASNSKTKYKYNKDSFEVEEVNTNNQENMDEFDYCECCNEVKDYEDMVYSQEWNTFMCYNCGNDLEIKELFETTHD